MSLRTIQVSLLSYVGIFLLAVSFVIWPVINVLATAWPLQPGSSPWRFGFSGLISDIHNTVALGLVLAMAAAHLLRNRVFLRVLSVGALLGAVCLLIALVLFPLDVLQVAGSAPEGAQGTLRMGGLTSELKHLMAFFTWAFLGLGGWRSTNIRLWESDAEGAGRGSADLLVVPTGKKAAATGGEKA